MLPFGELALARVLPRTKGLVSRDAIATGLEEVSRLTRQMEFRLFVPFVCLERAELARLNGDAPGRQRELRQGAPAVPRDWSPIRAEQVVRELAG
jgi:hypothetical protein